MEYIKNFTDHLVQQSWQIAVLFLIVAVGSFLLRNKSSHWRYLLWCVILAKCLLPPVMTFKAAVLPNDVIQDRSVVGYPASNFRNQTSDVKLKFQEPKNNSQTISNDRNSKLDSRFRGNDKRGNDMGVDGVNRRHYAVMDYIKEYFHILVFAVWGVGAIALLVVAGVKAFLLNRWLLRHRRLPSKDVSGEIEKLKSTVSSKFRSRIWVVEKITQPFVWGLWRGCAYLPAGSKNSADVIMHELAHIIRLDAFVNLLQIFAQAIFWFHPFVWIANNRIRAEREKSCDEIAIARLKVSPRSYSSAVVDVLVREYQARKALPSLAVAGPVKNIEERIRTVMAQGKKFYSRPTAAAVITVLILAAIFVPTTIAITKAEVKATRAPNHGSSLFGAGQAENTEVAEIKETEKQDDFKATLSNGTTVELVGVCEFSNGEVKRWWQPNGAFLENPVNLKYRPDYEYTTTGFLVRLNKSADLIKWNIEGAIDHLGNVEITDSNNAPTELYEKLQEHAHLVRIDGLNTTNIILTISPEWNLKGRFDGKYFIGKHDPKIKFIETYETGNGLNVVFQNEQQGYENSLRATISIEAAKRIKNRTIIDGRLGAVYSKDGEKQTSALFEDIKLSDVTYFEFFSRPYAEKVTFKNVSLKPNFKTDVQIGTDEQVSSGAGEKERLQTISDANLNLSIVIPANWQCYKEPDAGRYKFLWQLAPSSLKAEAVFIGTLTSGLAKTAKQIAVEDSAILKSYFDKYTVREDSWTDAFIAGLPTAKFTADYLFEAKQMVEHRTYILGESMVYWFVFRIEKGQFEANKPLFDSITNSFRLQNEPIGQDEGDKNIDVYIEDFDVSPYEAGGLYTVTAKIGNHGTATAPSFSMSFFRGDPKDNLNLHGKQQSGSYGAGPIKPGEFWNEQSSPFALNEGRNVVFVVLDVNNDIAEANETNNQAMLGIVVKNGKIIEKRFAQSVIIIRSSDGQIGATVKGVRVETISESRELKAPEDACAPTTKKEWFEQLLSKNVTVDIDKSPDGNRLTVQYAVIAVCEAAGVPYKWEKSAKLAEPERRSFIEPLHIKDTPAREAITNILKPFGLNYAVDGDGLFIYKNQEPVQNKEQKRPGIPQKDYIPKTSTVDANGWIVDKIDYPFVDDPQIVGRWISVDFIRDINDFQAGSQQWSGELHLKELVILPQGKMGRQWTGAWTKGFIFDPEDKTASKYIIKHIGDSDYMFFEWKSGDYFIRGRKPAYYVLQKETAGIELPIELKAFDEWSMENFKQYLDNSENGDSEDMCLRELKVGTGDYRYRAISQLGSLKSKKAIPDLTVIAFSRLQGDNKAKWMAVRALGLIGDKAVMGDLIHLMYHYNRNTRLYARVSLVRLGGRDLGSDWQKWAAWYKNRIDDKFSTKKIEWTTDKKMANEKLQMQEDQAWLKSLVEEWEIKNKYSR